MDDRIGQFRAAAFVQSQQEAAFRTLNPKSETDVLRGSLQGESTLPSTIQAELDTNPFLRPQDPDIRATLSALLGF